MEVLCRSGYHAGRVPILSSAGRVAEGLGGPQGGNWHGRRGSKRAVAAGVHCNMAGITAPHRSPLTTGAVLVLQIGVSPTITCTAKGRHGVKAVLTAASTDVHNVQLGVWPCRLFHAWLSALRCFDAKRPGHSVTQSYFVKKEKEKKKERKVFICPSIGQRSRSCGGREGGGERGVLYATGGITADWQV